MYFIYVFILKSPPVSHPPCTFYAHPDMYMYKIKRKIKRVQILHKHTVTLPQSTPKKVLLVLPLMSLE